MGSVAGQKSRVFPHFLWESRNQFAVWGNSEPPVLQMKKTEAQRDQGPPPRSCSWHWSADLCASASQVPAAHVIDEEGQALSREGVWPRSHGRERAASVCGALPTPRPKMRDLRPSSPGATPPPSLLLPRVCAQDHCACGVCPSTYKPADWHVLAARFQAGVLVPTARDLVQPSRRSSGTQAGTSWSEPWQEPRPGPRQPAPHPAAITSSRCNH